MLRTDKVVGSKYFLSCSALEGKNKDIEVVVDYDLGQTFEDFEPVVLEGIEMNYYTRRDEFNVNLTFKAKAIKSAAKGK